jgi:acetyl-CoA/propionyl-CoA carboxylase biotin carboxyl carrier protein
MFKVIVRGRTREEALARLDVALSETAVLGVENNVAFLRALTRHPAFRVGDLRTDFLDVEDRVARFAAAGLAPRDAALVAAAAESLGLLRPVARGGAPGTPSAWERLSGWRLLPGGAP